MNGFNTESTLPRTGHERSTRRITVAAPDTPVTIGELLTMPQLRQAGVISVPDWIAAVTVDAVQVLDLAEAASHLLGGELLLTTGLGFTNDADWFDDYVRTLVAAEVRAIGFGIEPVYSTVPQGLTDACARHGLPLIAFPEPVAFIDVITAFHAALEQRRVAELQTLNAITFDLLRAAVSRTPAIQAVNSLAKHLNLLAVIHLGDEHLHAGHVQGHTTDEILAELRSHPKFIELDDPRTKTRRLRLANDTLDALVTTVRSPSARAPMTGTLTFIAPRDFGSTELTAHLRAAALLELLYADQPTTSAKLDTLLMSLLLSSLSRPDKHERQLAARELRKALDAGNKYAVAVARLRNGETARPQDLSWWRSALRTPLVDLHRNTLRAVTKRPLSDRQFHAMSEAGWDIRVASDISADEIPAAMEQSEILLGRHGHASIWQGLASTPAQRAASLTLLAPLGDDGAAAGNELRTTLHAWLRHHGAWDATARALNVHRNVIRRRIEIAAQKLQCDVDDARVRAELLLALDALADS